MGRVKTDRLEIEDDKAATAQTATNINEDSEQALEIDECEIAIVFTDGSEILISK